MLEISECLNLVVKTLDDMKAGDLINLDVRELTTISDYMVIATGTSSRHVQAMADNLVEKIKPLVDYPINIDADLDREWILVDLGDILVHIMQPQARAFYSLERLWGPTNPRSFGSAGSANSAGFSS
jgi:ribosome-associated protein